LKVAVRFRLDYAAITMNGSRPPSQSVLSLRLSRATAAGTPLLMNRNHSGSINLAALASLAAAIAALAAVATSAVVYRQVREQTEGARFSIKLESLWHLDDQWNSSAMLDIRSAAAGGLLEGRPTADLDDVLRFFEELALLVQRGAVDEELVAFEFYWPLANYWMAMRDYVQRVEHDRPSAWSEVGTLVNRLGAIEAQRRNVPVTDALPSKEQQHNFLLDEQGSNECSDDGDTHKTPL
jgi:hypothetical protein